MNEPAATPDDAVLRAAGEIVRAGKVAALTGAGVSTESGIPDFRSPGGLWSIFDPMEYASLDVFLREPSKAWRLFRALGKTCRDRQPNPAHRALATLETEGWIVGVVTQNIDGLHQAAGSGRVLEIHGNGERLRCLGCGATRPFERAHLEDDAPLPRCPACGTILKPDVVLFGEEVQQSDAIAGLVSGCDLLLVVGTSANVYPAAWLPEQVRSHGGRVVEFNLERCLPAALFVPGPVGTTLPATVEAVAALAREGRA